MNDYVTAARRFQEENVTKLIHILTRHFGEQHAEETRDEGGDAQVCGCSTAGPCQRHDYRNPSSGVSSSGTAHPADVDTLAEKIGRGLRTLQGEFDERNDHDPDMDSRAALNVIRKVLIRESLLATQDASVLVPWVQHQWKCARATGYLGSEWLESKFKCTCGLSEALERIKR